MKRIVIVRNLTLILALCAASWAQSATQARPEQQSPAEKPPCCAKMNTAVDAKDGASCRRHAANHDAQKGDNKDQAACCGGKEAASCCAGKDAKSCPRAQAKTGCCAECGKDKTAANCCGASCAKECGACCGACSKTEKTAKNCGGREVRS